MNVNYSLHAGKIYFWIFIVFFPFGLLFYNYFGLTYIDEIIVLLLTIYWIKVKGITKELKILVSVFLFYLLYSIFITRINGNIAPFYDLQQQIKPYIVILATLSLKPQFTALQVRILKKYIIVSAIILFFIYIGGEEAMFVILGHPSVGAITSLTLGLFYLYLSNKDKTSLIISMVIILCGIFSMKSKLFGEVCVFIGIYFFLKKRVKRISLKYLIYGSGLIACIIYIVWEKFSFYYMVGFTDDSNIARPVLYKTAWNILCDYIPFGSGLGTFADEASRVFYSPIYRMYGIDGVWGLSLEKSSFIADTFFPILAQYGFAGIMLFIMFWKYVYMKVKNIPNFKNYKIGLILLTCLFIESTSDSSMLSNRGVLIMILLAFCCNSYTLDNVYKR